jgi:hypothetical protein
MKTIVVGALVVVAATATATVAERGLEIYWVDVEGGGATLIVTPARESVLIKLSVDPRGRSYTVWVPSTGHRQTYATRAR